MKKIIIIILTMGFSSISLSKDGGYIRKMTITSEEIFAIDEFSGSSREKFFSQLSSGQFELLIPKERFIFKAPNCRRNIQLRMWPVYSDTKNAKELLEKRWVVLEKLRAIKNGKEKNITIPVDPQPYMKLGKNGEPILTYCNAFIPADFWKYSLDNNESNALERPAEQQNAPLELENK